MSLVKTFYHTARAEGFDVATGKARRYLKRARAPKPKQITGHDYAIEMWRELARRDAFLANRMSRRGGGANVAIIGDLNVVQCRKYRVEQLAAFLRSLGHSASYAHFEDAPRAMSLLQHASHVVFYRLRCDALNLKYLYEARRLDAKVLYDIDDPLFSVPAYETYHNMDVVEPAQKQQFIYETPLYPPMMMSADLVSVSTPALAEHANRITGRQVVVRRNMIDPETLEKGLEAMARTTRRRDGKFRIIFASGSHGHEVDLLFIRKALEDVIAAHQNAELIIIGKFDPAHLSDTLRNATTFVPFARYDEYLAHIAQADCMVLPLMDDIFNRCKSAVRLIDASAVATPCITGVVSDTPNIIRNGVTGIIAHRPEDWRGAIESLLNDPAAARRMGAAAHREVISNWGFSREQNVVSHALLDWFSS